MPVAPRLPLSTVAGRIRSLRTESVLSQRQLAFLLGVHRTAVQQWEKPGKIGQLEGVHLGRLAYLLDTTDRYILNGIEPHPEREQPALRRRNSPALIDPFELLSIPRDTQFEESDRRDFIKPAWSRRVEAAWRKIGYARPAPPHS